MKKMIAIIFCALITVTSAVSLTGCGCSDKAVNNTTSAVSQSEEPSKDIVGKWGGRTDDVDVNFKDDGTCEIGGIQGTYEVDDKNTLTVTPKSENENDNPQPMVFEYYSGDTTVSSVPSNQWAIQNDTIYINGYQYTRQATTEESQSENSQSGSKSDSSKNESKSGSSKSESKSGSSKSESKSDSSQIAAESAVIGQNPESTVSKSEHAEGEEDEVVVIYQNLDDFIDMED